MTHLSKQFKSIIEAAYSGMEIGDDWTKDQHKVLIGSSEGMMAEKLDQGDTPRYALQRIFAFYTPESDPEGVRAAWFMDLAQAKADELGISLDSRDDDQSLPESSSMPLGQGEQKPHSGLAGVGATIKEKFKEGFGPKDQ